MKLQVDTVAKTIKIEEAVNLGELIKNLNALFPNEEWRGYTLKPEVILNWTSYPIITYPYFYRDYSNPIYYNGGSSDNKVTFNDMPTTVYNVQV